MPETAWELVAPPPTAPVEALAHAPTFSVIIPAYQAAATIGEAVASALGQTTPAHEVIVCDDGSTDDLERALTPYRERIILLRQENRGAAAARNTALRAASGDFVLSLDSDDVLLGHGLEALGELARRRPDLDLLSPDVYYESDGRLVGRFYDANPFAVEDQRSAILAGCFVGWPAARRERLLASGGFDESLAIAHDWDAWLRLVFAGSRAGLVREPLLRYRLRAGSLTAARTRSLRERVVVLDKAAVTLELRPHERQALGAARARANTRALLAEAREALLERRSDARRRALDLSTAPGVAVGTRMLGLAAALLPGMGGRLLARGPAARAGAAARGTPSRGS
ncbi:MAG TPA: glycosyltransferase [Gaiellaceae bacterium]|nr:glycosyltransferase [Gaiellaceae bacterium]